MKYKRLGIWTHTVQRASQCDFDDEIETSPSLIDYDSEDDMLEPV